MDPNAERNAASTRFQILSGVQFVSGFLLIFFGSYCVTIHGGPAQNGVPYYAGAYFTGIPDIILSWVGGAIVYIGSKSPTEVLATRDGRPAMLLYIILTPLTFIFCVIGAVLTGVFGVNTADDKLSYQTKLNFNFGMAAFLFTLELMSITTTLGSMCVCCLYSPYFGVKFKFEEQHVPGTLQVRSAENEADENQVYAMHKWRHHVNMDVNLIRIQEYMETSRNTNM